MVDTAKIQRSIAACIENGERLAEEADWSMHRASSSVALAMLAQEECAKAFVLALVRDGVMPWTDDVRRSLSVHECKHLVTIIMEWLLEISERRFEDMLAQREVDTTPESLPVDVATAMNIYRHEFIERIGKRHRERFSDWKGRARRIADGQRDRRKQLALYVNVAQDGSPSSTPSDSDGAFQEELQRAKALIEFAKNADRGVIFAWRQYKSFSDLFAEMFRDHGPDGVPIGPDETYDDLMPGVRFVKKTISCATVAGENDEKLE